LHTGCCRLTKQHTTRENTSFSATHTFGQVFFDSKKFVPVTPLHSFHLVNTSFVVYFFNPYSHSTGTGVHSQGYNSQGMWLTLYFQPVPRLRMCGHTPPTGRHEQGHLYLYILSRIIPPKQMACAADVGEVYSHTY
jgi:hypothetical protein